MLRGLKKIVAVLDMTAFGLSTISLVILSVVSVFFRFILNNPIKWSEEVQMILVVWSVFFGASIAVREKGHIAVDIVYDALHPAVRKLLSILIWIIIACSITAIGKLELDRVRDLIKSGIGTSILKIPSYIEYTGVVIACIFMLINHIITGAEELCKRSEKGEGES